MSEKRKIKPQEADHPPRMRTALTACFRNHGPCLSGSLTLEASIVLPLLIFCLSAFYTLFSGMAFELKLERAMAEGCRSLLPVCLSANVSGEEMPVILTKEPLELSVRSALSDAGVDASEISRMTSGLDFTGSGYNFLSEELQVVVHYRLRFPFSIPGIPGPGRRSSFRMRAWTGQEEIREETEEDMVYVTENGTVYHESPNCTYLSPSVHAVAYDALETERNASGGVYYPCERCARDTVPGSTVYVTTYGNRYHVSANCTQIRRNIRAVPRSQVTLPPCKKCSGGGS